MKRLLIGLLALILLAAPTVAQQLVNPGQYSATPPTLVDTQKGPLQMTSRGDARALVVGNGITGADGVANTTNISSASVVGSQATSVIRPFAIAPFRFNGSTWDRDFECTSTAVINVAAAATTQLVALTASQVIRVCSFVITGDTAATTAVFLYGTGTNCGTGGTALTGAMRMVDEGSIALSADGSLFRTASANALCLTAATGTVTGFVTYAKF